jgi:hypothetical protein
MLCFVLQNFHKTQPFLIKTKKYYLMVKAANTLIFNILVHLHILLMFSNRYFSTIPFLILSIYNSQISRLFWTFFKKIFHKKMSLYSNNLFKSYLYWFYKNFNLPIKYNTSDYKLIQFSTSTQELCVISKPVQLLHFTFHKKTFNSFIFFILNLLTENYYTQMSTFKLFYGFIFFKKNFNIYPFLNHFYFKVYSH